MKSIVPVNSAYFPAFDELYIVSDLHLGGLPGFQIFNSGNDFQKLTGYLTSISPDKKIGLLMNGDLVDFLAEKWASYFDPNNAVDKLDRIINDPAFQMVFKGLQDFAATKNRSLIINIGNHDLELALPWVRSHLLDILSAGNDEAKGRITFVFDGTGFVCKVGSADVLCVHGNEVDEWNVTNYETIRRIGRNIMQGRPIENWIPNAGSQLVIDIMNELKSRYPFIDLLKPEMQAVIPTILALAPEQQGKLLAIAATASRLLWDKLKIATGLLGRSDGSLASPDHLQYEMDHVFPSEDYHTNVRTSVIDSSQYSDTLLFETEKRFLNKVKPVSLIENELLQQNLGLFSSMRKLSRGDERSEVLREALEGLQQDRSFIITEPDETFKRLDNLVSEHFHFFIAGHTHLQKAIKRVRGNGYYYNSGTWVGLIQLEQEVLESREKFKMVFEAFKRGTLEALDSFTTKKLIRRQLTVVNISGDDSKTTGKLQYVDLEAKEEFLLDIAGSHFTYAK